MSEVKLMSKEEILVLPESEASHAFVACECEDDECDAECTDCIACIG